jgi:hypothetical protein
MLQSAGTGVAVAPPACLRSLLLLLLLLLRRLPAAMSMSSVSSTTPTGWQYHLLPASSGALCLDGSPGAFDYLPALPPPGPPPKPRCQLARIPSSGHPTYPTASSAPRSL